MEDIQNNRRSVWIDIASGKTMIQGMEIPMSKQVRKKKAAFIRGIPSVFQCD
jgi:hypothetical protein